MLAVGFAMSALRCLIPEDRWDDRWPRLSFWSLNLGLAWMSFATLLPGGALQLYEVLDADTPTPAASVICRAVRTPSWNGSGCPATRCSPSAGCCPCCG
ncbi:hypothetical protein ACFSL4_21155 [Streptomyces caeni]|uniref:Uncharacterized protein n=1 Tax=Streptomyces caeni TaxID=2307231 RepID=A0ABW4IUR9_9ACTN